MNLTKSNLFYLLVFIPIIISSCKKEDVVSSITIDKPTLSMVVGTKNILIATIKTSADINKFPVSWTSSNSSIIQVSGNGEIEAIAAGTVSITARAGDKFVSSTVTASSEMNPIFDRGFLVYLGDTLHTTVSNLFLLEIRNDNEGIDIFVNADTLATDSLPSGTYSLLTNPQTLKDFKPNTIISGLNDGFTSYYGKPQSMFGYSVRPIEKGSIVITAYKNGYYKVSYALIDVTNTVIYGSYTGPLEYHNFKKVSGQNKTALQQKLNGLKTTNSGFKIPLK